MTWKLINFVICTTLLVATALFGSTKLLSLKITPRNCQAPCTVYIALSVQRHPDNRWAVVEVDGPVFRSSQIQLDGDQAPIYQEPMWAKDLPAGEYEVRAMLYQIGKDPRLGREVERQVIAFEVHGEGGQ